MEQTQNNDNILTKTLIKVAVKICVLCGMVELLACNIIDAKKRTPHTLSRVDVMESLRVEEEMTKKMCQPVSPGHQRAPPQQRSALGNDGRDLFAIREPSEKNHLHLADQGEN